MSDAIFDGLIQLLEGVTPPFADIIIGRPATIDQDRTVGLWYGGDRSDANGETVATLDDIGAIERIEICVFWLNPAGASRDLLATVEEEVRAAVRAIKKAVHAHILLAGTAGAGLIQNAWVGAANAGIWKDEGGARFSTAIIPYEFETLGMDALND